MGYRDENIWLDVASDGKKAQDALFRRALGLSGETIVPVVPRRKAGTPVPLKSAYDSEIGVVYVILDADTAPGWVAIHASWVGYRFYCTGHDGTYVQGDIPEAKLYGRGLPPQACGRVL